MEKILISLFFLLSVKTAFTQQNTILIIADDFGTDYCGFYEDAMDTAKMPNIRSLLSRGVRFRNAWGTPYCSPTRACMLTGRYSFRTGVGTVIGGANSTQLDTAEMSLAKLLKLYAPTQYATGQVGKWHLQAPTANNLTNPNRMGFDYFSGPYTGAITSFTNWSKVTNGVSRNVTNYATTENVNDAISWLDTVPRNKPFFLWMGFNAPHTPFHLPPDSLHTSQGLTGTTMHINQNPKLYYKAMIEALDTEIGRLIRHLKATNRFDNTNIIFVGDNGPVPQVSQIADKTHVKGTLYEYGIREPLIISGPAVVNPNRVSSALVSVTDLFATILEMSNFTNWSAAIPLSKQPTDARSILPILKNTATDVRTWNFTEQFRSMPDSVNGKAIRNMTYKLIHFDNNKQEFYNVVADPNEQTNLLRRTLTNVELSNYTTLCNQLADLVGGTMRRCLLSNVEDISSQVRVFPSVFTTQLTIESDQPCTYELYDALGHSILRGGMSVKNNLQTADLPKGMYILRCQIGKQVLEKKLVKVE
jgi:arylsulfatase B